MTYALLVLLFASFWCFGISVLFKEEMLLEKLGIWMDENLPIYLNKPLWKCAICMASIPFLYVNHQSLLFGKVIISLSVVCSQKLTVISL